MARLTCSVGVEKAFPVPLTHTSVPETMRNSCPARDRTPMSLASHPDAPGCRPPRSPCQHHVAEATRCGMRGRIATPAASLLRRQ